MPLNKPVLIPVLGLSIVFLAGLLFYRSLTDESIPGENLYRLGNQKLQQGRNTEALQAFDKGLSRNPDYAPLYMGRAIALMQLERYTESKSFFDKAIALDSRFAEGYANRGILNDRTGHFEAAVMDYRKAIELKPETGSGPGWLWRFMHHNGQKPSTILDRKNYLEQELEKPPLKRLLRVPQTDAKQKMYTP